MLEDLGMTTNDYNTGNTIFFTCFLLAEIPGQLLSKKLGCDVWIPIEMCLWSLVSIAQCRITGKAGFYWTRALMGLLEGGFIPDLILWLSYFYTSGELSIRLAYFWASLQLTQVFNALFAFLIFHIKFGMPGWAWLFLLCGVLTLGIGISSWFLMVPSVVQTKRPWDRNGWFTTREEMIIVNKVLRDDPSKGDMHNREGIPFKMLIEGITDKYLWPIYFLGLIAYIPSQTVNTYLTLLLRSMGYSTFAANLMAIPSYLINMVLLLWITNFSERVGSVFNVCQLQPLWAAPLLAVLRWWGGAFDNQWVTYVILTLIIATPYIHPILAGACSRNSHSIKTRTISASLYNMSVQLDSIIASNVYREEDKPLYKRGNLILFLITVSLFPILFFTRRFYERMNRQRQNLWGRMSEEEQENYLHNTTDKGSERLNFRFAY